MWGENVRKTRKYELIEEDFKRARKNIEIR
jgi:hypothetical protein